MKKSEYASSSMNFACRRMLVEIFFVFLLNCFNVVFVLSLCLCVFLIFCVLMCFCIVVFVASFSFASSLSRRVARLFIFFVMSIFSFWYIGNFVLCLCFFSVGVCCFLV